MARGGQREKRGWMNVLFNFVCHKLESLFIQTGSEKMDNLKSEDVCGTGRAPSRPRKSKK
jgi:phosphoserine aminotransferase